ncbi:hypothetical protein Tco_1136552 [Tanacetum coccineum]
MIYVNKLKTHSENDNEKADIPSLPPPKPTISYVDDFDFFKDFENEFPAIVYNDAQTYKSDYLTEQTLSPQYNNESDLNDETSLSEYDEVGQNVLYFNDLFPFNVIHPDDLKSDEKNNNNEIDIIQSSEGNLNTHRSNMLMETSRDKIDKIFDEESFVLELNVNIATWIYLFNGMPLCFIMNLYVPFGILFDPKRYYKDGDCTLMLWRPRAIRHMALPPREQRHPFLRYEGLQYTEADIEDFETRLTRIYRREVHRVQVFDFGGLPDLMAGGLSGRMLMEHMDAQGVSLFTSRAWRRLFDIRRPLADSARQIPDKGDLRDYWIGISSAGDFLGTTPSYTATRDPILKLCHRLISCSIFRRSQAPEKVTVTDLFYLRGMDVGSINVPYLLVRYWRLFAAGRKSGAHISGRQFVARLAEHFGLQTREILGGLTIIASKLLIIDMAELVRLHICMEVDDTWDWVAMGPERQLDAAAGAPLFRHPCMAPQQPPPPSPPTVAYELCHPENKETERRRGKDLCIDGSGPYMDLWERSMTDQQEILTYGGFSCMVQ